ncbi:MAG TPA: TonB-dependent siderophore receptor [Leptolyngbyaceae cyanobacterium]
MNKLQLASTWGLAGFVMLAIAQPVQADVNKVTAVEVISTATGIEIVVKTTDNKPLQVFTSSYGKTFVANVLNTQLQLPDNKNFRQVNPTEGIASISVTQQGVNSIRVIVTGTNSLPTAKVEKSDTSAGLRQRSLVISLTSPSGTTAQQPISKPQLPAAPQNETAPEEDFTQEKPASPEQDEKIEIVVTGKQETGYNPPNAITATKTDTPLRDIPQSIQVIPRQVLEDQGVTRLQDALQNVSGITKWGNFGGTEGGGFVIRGFQQDAIFRDGFRNSNFYNFPETANIEQIEVLRGPASVLFGQAQPGGIVNFTTKKPLREPYYNLSFEAGSYDFYRPTLDISGPLNADKNLLYRLNIAYQNSDSFRDFVNTERFFIAPVLSWEIGDRTTLSLNFEYLYNDPLYDRGLTALDDGSLPLPIDRFLGYPSLDDYKQKFYRGGYTFEHRFSDNWQLRNGFALTSRKYGGDNVNNNGDLIDDRFFPKELRDDSSIDESYTLQTDLTGKFNTGSIAHQILFGLELDRQTSYYNSQIAELPPIDIFDPVYDISRPTEFEQGFNQRIFLDSIGIYLQDQITLLDNLKLLVGGRFDSFEQDAEFPADDTENNQSDNAFSPRIGIVYQPNETISLYGSYTRSFFPADVYSRSADNSPFNPERGTQYEIGIKGDFLDSRLSGTLAAYHITKSNVLTTDPIDDEFSIQVGEQRSQGIELNVAGEILPGWKIIAGYAYTDAEVSEDLNIPVGDRLTNVAENTANLWTTYEIQTGNLQGIGFGLGLFYVGERETELPNSNAELPSYFRTDAAIFYRRDNWRAAINIRNLFDTEYYETSQFRNIVYPGAPFTVVGTLSVEF